ncbi:TetR/AcrR family transcriptional regulator [Brevibacterium oceani]|uniref:TetR/AcrR family transcriptional regulator n=1 Tax=Brevibacterium oceani TaxID=358099 RepID=UPI0015E67049|nr:TetR/AcrR family transcriptional regulator [Brevibacterium oceani]
MAGPRGEYRKTAARREQILDAAFTVFSTSGYSSSSLSEIARLVGISQTGVLHHFSGGKIALLRAVLDRRDRIAESILNDQHGTDFLRSLLEISRQQYRQRGVVQLYRILSAESTNPEHPAHGYFKDRIHRICDAVTVAFQEVAADGGLKPGVDPRAAAISTLAITEGIELLWLNGVEVDLVEDVRTHMEGYLLAPL